MALSLKQAKTGPVAKRAVAAKPALRRAVVAQAQAKPAQQVRSSSDGRASERWPPVRDRRRSQASAGPGAIPDPIGGRTGGREREQTSERPIFPPTSLSLTRRPSLHRRLLHPVHTPPNRWPWPPASARPWPWPSPRPRRPPRRRSWSPRCVALPFAGAAALLPRRPIAFGTPLAANAAPLGVDRARARDATDLADALGSAGPGRSTGEGGETDRTRRWGSLLPRPCRRRRRRLSLAVPELTPPPPPPPCNRNTTTKTTGRARHRPGRLGRDRRDVFVLPVARRLGPLGHVCGRSRRRCSRRGGSGGGGGTGTASRAPFPSVCWAPSCAHRRFF